jgi:hypothetical protein
MSTRKSSGKGGYGTGEAENCLKNISKNLSDQPDTRHGSDHV